MLASQTGLPAGQSEAVTQPTQVPLLALQTGVDAAHWDPLLAEHCAQAPLGWQAGATPPHSPSPVQPRQVCEPGSQTGFGPLQSAAARQPTQAPATALQTGVAPVHADTFWAEHWPQAPLGWQAGVDPPQSPSLEHVRQVWVARSQAGVDPVQSEFATQVTQRPVPASQAGVAPLHWVLLEDEQTPQAPFG